MAAAPTSMIPRMDRVASIEPTHGLSSALTMSFTVITAPSSARPTFRLSAIGLTRTPRALTVPPATRKPTTNVAATIHQP